MTAGARPASDAPRILHLLDGHGIGGTEAFVARLTSAHAQRGVPQLVVMLRGCARLRDLLAAGRVTFLDLATRTNDALDAWRRLTLATTRFAPDVISGWLVHGNLLAVALRRMAAPRSAVVWNIRQGLGDVRRERRATRVLLRVAAGLSDHADRVVYNAERGRAEHLAAGYSARNAAVIPNGFDLRALAPDPAGGASVRAEMGIAADAPVVGMAARFHPQKDHAGFLESFALVRATGIPAHALLAGDGVTLANPTLSARLDALRLGDSVHLLGERSDVRALYSAMDVATLASTSEAFPNAIAEAMACGVACVAPDVGDVRAIIGDTGAVVPVGDRRALADAIAVRLRDRAATHRAGAAARDRIARDYSLESTSSRFLDMFVQVAAARAARNR